MTTLHLRKSIDRSPLRCGLPFIAIALCCFALAPAPKAFGALYPPADGGYAGNNTAEGQNALQSLTSGLNNTAVGFGALSSDSTGGYNVAVGSNALALNTNGSFNMAIGTEALHNNTAASANLAIGFRVLFSNTTGNNLTGVGAGALYQNTTGSFNTAVGAAALSSNTAGANNTAVGRQALFSNTTGNGSTAVGYGALGFNTATGNTATGFQALLNNTTGGLNTAIGWDALKNNITGQGNIALGYDAGVFLDTGDNNIDIGNIGSAGDSGIIRIGNFSNTTTFITGIYNVNEGGTPLAVYIKGDGQLGTMASSRRFKKEIKPMEQTSQAILGLQPVTFQYKSDPTGAAQFGLIAEEVAKVDPDLVVRDAEGEIYSVRYEAVNAMLLNEFLKEHRKVDEQDRRVQEQEATITRLKSTVAKQEATAAHQQEQIEALTAGLQKVSEQVEMSRPEPRTVLNNK